MEAQEMNKGLSVRVSNQVKSMALQKKTVRKFSGRSNKAPQAGLEPATL